MREIISCYVNFCGRQLYRFSLPVHHSFEQDPGAIEMRRLPGQEGAARSYSVIEFSPKNLSVRLPNRQNGGVAACRSVCSGIEAELRYHAVHTEEQITNCLCFRGTGQKYFRGSVATGDI